MKVYTLSEGECMYVCVCSTDFNVFCMLTSHEREESPSPADIRGVTE